MTYGSFNVSDLAVLSANHFELIADLGNKIHQVTLGVQKINARGPVLNYPHPEGTAMPMIV